MSIELQRIKQRYNIIGDCPALNLALDTALKVAGVDLNVLIVGENGVGKEVFPRIIHEHSARKNKKYFAINCGSIPEGTIDSELFGHEKGSFTGALGEREGYFAVANGGTLFLDEVGELPLSTQARLLRVLETGEYIRVGASQIQKTDVRIVAATNVDLQRAISQGRFREDLYYRLNTIPIRVPALKERGEDILKLFQKFALEMSERYHFPVITLKPDAKQMLLQYHWPGNVRQLKNVAENISVTADSREIDAEIIKHYLPLEQQSNEIVWINSSQSQANDIDNSLLLKMYSDLKQEVQELKQVVRNYQQKNASTSYADVTPIVQKSLPAPTPILATKEEEKEYTDEVVTLEEMEKRFIAKALERNKGDRNAAAFELGISTRTLYRKIKDYGWK